MCRLRGRVPVYPKLALGVHVHRRVLLVRHGVCLPVRGDSSYLRPRRGWLQVLWWSRTTDCMHMYRWVQRAGGHQQLF